MSKDKNVKRWKCQKIKKSKDKKSHHAANLPSAPRPATSITTFSTSTWMDLIELICQIHSYSHFHFLPNSLLFTLSDKLFYPSGGTKNKNGIRDAWSTADVYNGWSSGLLLVLYKYFFVRFVRLFFFTSTLIPPIFGLFGCFLHKYLDSPCLVCLFGFLFTGTLIPPVFCLVGCFLHKYLDSPCFSSLFFLFLFGLFGCFLHRYLDSPVRLATSS